MGAIALAFLASSGMVRAQEPEAEPEKPESRPPAVFVSAEIGFGARDVSGNRNKLGQYVIPPEGWYLKELTLQPRSMPYDGYAYLTLRGYGADPIRADAELGLNGARHRFWYWADRNRSIANTAQVVAQSNRRGDGITYSGLIAPDFGWSVRYATQNQNRFFEAPREALRTRTKEWDVAAFGTVGQGSLGIALTDAQFYDRMLALPNTSTRTIYLTGLWSPGPEGDLEGSVATRTINRSGTGVGRVNQFVLAGNMSLGGAGDLAIRGEAEHASWPITESAYVTDRRLVETVFSSRYRTTAMTFRWQYREAERIRGDGQYLDVPKWTTFSGRITNRLTRQARLTLRGSTERMWQRPQMTTTDVRSALWDGRDNFEARLDVGDETFSGYASWRTRRNGNSVRGTNVTNGTASAGATWTLSPALEIFAEYSLESWHGRSEDMAFPTLGNFMADSRVGSVGISYALDSRSFFWAGYTQAVTDNDNPLQMRDGNTEARYLTASFRRRIGPAQEVSVTIAPWTYRDRTDPTMNVTATTLVLSGKTRF